MLICFDKSKNAALIRLENAICVLSIIVDRMLFVKQVKFFLILVQRHLPEFII